MSAAVTNPFTAKAASGSSWNTTVEKPDQLLAGGNTLSGNVSKAQTAAEAVNAATNSLASTTGTVGSAAVTPPDWSSVLSGLQKVGTAYGGGSSSWASGASDTALSNIQSWFSGLSPELQSKYTPYVGQTAASAFQGTGGSPEFFSSRFENSLPDFARTPEEWTKIASDYAAAQEAAVGPSWNPSIPAGVAPPVGSLQGADYAKVLSPYQADYQAWYNTPTDTGLQGELGGSGVTQNMFPGDYMGFINAQRGENLVPGDWGSFVRGGGAQGLDYAHAQEAWKSTPEYQAAQQAQQEAAAAQAAKAASNQAAYNQLSQLGIPGDVFFVQSKSRLYTQYFQDFTGIECDLCLRLEPPAELVPQVHQRKRLILTNPGLTCTWQL